MKFNRFLRSAFIMAAALPLLWCGGCSEDTTETQVVPLIELSTETVSVTRLGVDKNGNYAYVRITSNVYWQASYPAEAREWLTLSMMGGDPGTLTMSLEFAENTFDFDRTADVTLETLTGYKRVFRVIQRGTGDVVILLNDGFTGSYNEGTPVSEYLPYEVEGLDYLTVHYDGENATISQEEPSFGYEGASGGNNVLLQGKDAYISMQGINAERTQSFDLSFGVCGHNNATFTEEDIKLEISKDEKNWAEVPFTISVPATVEAVQTRGEMTGWQYAYTTFAIQSAVKDLYIRLRVAGEQSLRIDDWVINEGPADATVIEFPKPKPTGPAEPEIVTLWEESFDAFTADLVDANAAHFTGFFDSPTAITNNPDTRIDKLGDNTALWTATGITYDGATPYVYAHVGNIKLGTNSAAGNIVLPAIASLTEPTDLTITFKATRTKEDRKKVYNVSIYAGEGTLDVSQIEVENYAYPVVPAETEAERANYQEFTIHVEGATAATRVMIAAAEGASQIIMDDFKIEGLIGGEPAAQIEGFPVTWSFPADGESTGVVAIDNTANNCIFRVQSDENPDAKIDISIDTFSGKNPNKYDVNYDLGGVQTNGMRFYSFVTDDYILFTVPVKNLTSGTNLRFYGWMSGSAKGSRFLIMEYSTDNKATWKAVNTRKGEFGTADGTVAMHEITYTVILATEASVPVEVDETFTVEGDIEEGNFFLRFRVCDPLTIDMTRNNSATAAGLNRLFYKVGGAPVSISLADGSTTPDPGTDPEPTATLTVGGVTDGKIAFAADATEGAQFTVKSTVSDWTIESDIDWATIEPMTGKADEEVTVTVTPKSQNPEQKLSGKLTIKAGEATPVEIALSQEAKAGDTPEPPTPTPGALWEEHFDLFTAEALAAATGNNDWDPFIEASGLTAGANEANSRIFQEKMNDLWNATGITSYMESNAKLYAHVGCVKLGTASAKGDIVLPAITSLTEPTDLILTFKASAFNNGKVNDATAVAGEPVTYEVKINGAGTTDTPTFTVTNYTYPEGATTYEERANYQDVEIKIAGATAETRIQLVAARAAKARLFMDDFVIVADEPEAPAEPMEGLPVYWSFPTAAEATAQGLVKTGTTASVENYWYLSDDKAARIEPVVAKVPLSKVGTYKNGEQVSGDDYNTRFLMYSFLLNDYWLFTVPVKNFAAGTKLRFHTELGSSAGGPKYYILEYSADDKATWTAVGTKTEPIELGEGTTLTQHDVTFTAKMSVMPYANTPCDVTVEFTVDQAIAEGNLYFRLRVCDSANNNGVKEAAAGGTTRIRRSTNADGEYLTEATSITVVE